MTENLTYRMPGVPETYYRTGRYTVDHRTFGGELTLFDFEGHHTLASMAQKIARWESFDRQCQKATVQKLNNKVYRGKLEEDIEE